MYNIFMGMKKIIRQLEDYIQDRVSDAYAEGYREGLEDSDLGYASGIKAERERVIGMFKFLAQQELEAGSGNKAKTYHDMAELVNIANIDFTNHQEDEDF